MEDFTSKCARSQIYVHVAAYGCAKLNAILAHQVINDDR